MRLKRHICYLYAWSEMVEIFLAEEVDMIVCRTFRIQHLLHRYMFLEEETLLKTFARFLHQC